MKQAGTGKRRRCKKPTYALYSVRETRRIWWRNGTNPEPGMLVREWGTVETRRLRIADVEILGVCGALKLARMRRQLESYQQAAKASERKGK